YIDGALKFTTPDDFMNKYLQLSPGQHRITAKAWDDLGAFSSTTFVDAAPACSNTANRTVKICQPTSGATIKGEAGAVFQIVASAASNLKYSSTQIYIDGKLEYSNPAKDIIVEMEVPSTTGTHRVTVKGWDSSGSFSSSISITVK